MTIKSRQVCTGFSLIELLVGLTISTVLLSLVIRVYDGNHRLFLTNNALADMLFDGQFIIPLLNSNIALSGNTNVYSDMLNTQVNIHEEAAFILKNKIATELTFPLFPLISSEEGGVLADSIVINFIGSKSCTGTNFDFNDKELFHVVNQYYLDGTTLRCKGYDGRYLRGIKSNTSTSYSISLLENVHDLQVQYAIKITASENTEDALSEDIIANTANTANASNNKNTNTEQELIWLSADKLVSALTEQNQMVAIHIVLLLGGQTVTGLSKQTTIKLFDNHTFTPPDKVMIRKFETIIVLKGEKV